LVVLTRLLALLVLVAAACASPDGEDGPGTDTTSPATTSPVTTSPVTTSGTLSPDTTSPVTTSPVTTSGTLSPDTTSPVTTSPVTTSPVDVELPAALRGRDTLTVTIGERNLLVAVSDDAAERAQGLMFVSDLEDLDGMLFVWDTDHRGDFWMKDTLIPLDIVWFDAAGTLVGEAEMEPCQAEPCARYDPGVPYRYAVETPAGALDFVTPATQLRGVP
jgi:uncharacterized membrane protein (UPF0127 family)